MRTQESVARIQNELRRTNLPLKLSRSFYEQSTVDVAKLLLGKFLVRKHSDGDCIGRIVETEAYIGPQDLACHGSKGRTKRTEVIFGPPGRVYVYLIYGFYNMLNLVTEAKDYPAAVLIRAVEPLTGIEMMKQCRRTDELRNLASGPGKLCQAFAIDRRLNDADACGKELYVEDRGEPAPKMLATPRIGVDYAGKWKDKRLRFIVRDNEFVSKR
ncbi:MAG: DNA-3-methyladenine glycosylase [Deltaproteobacteria bacterium]|nr:DNA-3-methyladenine glycosylase [Deltaproteobacteria bacterium]